MKWLLDREKRDREQLQAVLEGKLPASSLQLQSPPDASLKPPPPDSSLKPPPPPAAVGTAAEEEPDWFAAYDKQREEKEALQRLKEEAEARRRREEKLKKLREEYNSNTKRWQQKRKVSESWR